MEMNKAYLLFIAYLFFYSAYAHVICAPRSFTYPSPPSSSTPPSSSSYSPPPKQASSPPPPKQASSPPPHSPPPKQASSPPPPKQASSPLPHSPPPKQASSPPPKQASSPPPHSPPPKQASSPPPPPHSPPPSKQASSPPPHSPPPHSSSPPKQVSSPPSHHVQSPPPSEPLPREESPLGFHLQPGEHHNPIPHLKKIIPELTARAQGTFSPLLKEICGGTDYPDICLSSLSGGQFKLDPLSILKAEITAVVDRTKEAIALVNNIIDNPTSDGFTARVLTACKDSYTDVLDNIQTSIELLGSGGPSCDYDTISTYLSAAISNSGTCTDGFSEMPGDDSPTSDLDKMISHLVANALYMVEHVRKLARHPTPA